MLCRDPTRSGPSCQIALAAERQDVDKVSGNVDSHSNRARAVQRHLADVLRRNWDPLGVREARGSQTMPIFATSRASCEGVSLGSTVSV
jgi:hypothetical protein